jgi:hypothetical protein
MTETPNYRVKIIFYDEAIGIDEPTATSDEPLYSNGAELETQAKLTYRRHLSHLTSEQ